VKGGLEYTVRLLSFSRGAQMRGGRRKWKRKPSTFGSLVLQLGGVRKSSRLLGYDPAYISLLAWGQRRLTPAVLDRLAALGQQSERP
jgi:hypothetical protein